MTITLTPETGTVLLRIAERTGLEPPLVASRLLRDALVQSEQDHAGNAAAIHEGIKDVEAGRERPYEEYVAERRLGVSPRP